MTMFKLSNKFLSVDIYHSIIDRQHFLAQLKDLFNWTELAAPLLDLANNEAGGRPRHSPVIMLKMLLLSYLYDLSDRDTEFFCTSNLYAKYFLSLPIDGHAPDFTSVSRFRLEVLDKKGTEYFITLFRSLTAQAEQQGVVIGAVQALDSTHTPADVNTFKDGHDRKHYDAKPRDPDAAWGVKGHETKMTPVGKQVTVLKSFFGYKAHLLGETGHGIITGLDVSPGNLSDLDGGDILIHRILTNNEQKKIKVLTADKGYGCPVWINLLEKHTNLLTAFFLPENMLTKGNDKTKWQEYVDNPGRKAWRKERTVIERVNGDVKDNHSLRRARYLGLKKYHVQTALSSIAHNVKIFVKLLSGARFRPA